MGGVQNRGFGSMDEAKKRLIASMGGKKAHALGRAHKWSKEEAQMAGRRGGLASALKKKLEKEAKAAAEAAA